MDNRNNNEEAAHVEVRTSGKGRYPQHKNAAAERKRPPEGEAPPQRKRRQPVEEEVRQRRRRPPEDGEIRQKRRRPPEDGEMQQRRRRPPEEEKVQQRRHRPPDDGEVRRRSPKPSEDHEAPDIRRRKSGTTQHTYSEKNAALSAQAEKRRRPPDGDDIRKRRKNTMNGNGKPSKKHNIDRFDEAEESRKTSRGCLFPVFLMLICLVVFLVSFAVFVSFMQEHSVSDLINIIRGEEVSADSESEPATNEDYVDTNNLFKKTEESLYNTERNGVVSQISLGSNTIKIYDTDNESSVLLSFDSNTEVSDENGLDISISKVNEGDLIIFTCDENKNLLTLKENSDVGEYTSLDVRVNTARKLITISDNVYKYNNNTVFRYKDSVISPKDITEFDVITVKAIDNKAWSVIMEKSHGRLKFTNYENISNVTYSVDGSEFIDIPESSTINLTEGLHTITVQSPSCSDFTKEFIIKKDTEAEMNLSSVQISRGSLIVDTTATGAALYVDGVERSFGNPMFLDYGSHKVTATRRDKTVSQYITINKEQTILDVQFD